MSGLRLYFRLAVASFRAQAQYPVSTILLTFGQLITTFAEIVGIWALFDRFGSVRGWHFGEIAVFYGLVNTMFAFADILTRGFDTLGSEFLRTGAFDRVLLRPRSITLLLMGHDVRISRLSRAAQGLFVLVVGSQMGDITWSAADIALGLWALTGGIALFTGLFVLQGTLSFWTIESLEAANALTYGGVQAAQFPLSLYHGSVRGLLTFVVPLACVAYYPVLTILGREDPLGAPAWFGPIAPLAGWIFLGVSFIAWRIGVRHYTSTGS